MTHEQGEEAARGFFGRRRHVYSRPCPMCSRKSKDDTFEGSLFLEKGSRGRDAASQSGYSLTLQSLYSVRSARFCQRATLDPTFFIPIHFATPRKVLCMFCLVRHQWTDTRIDRWTPSHLARNGGFHFPSGISAVFTKSCCLLLAESAHRHLLSTRTCR